jgi:hypothetical protein
MVYGKHRFTYSQWLYIYKYLNQQASTGGHTLKGNHPQMAELLRLLNYDEITVSRMMIVFERMGSYLLILLGLLVARGYCYQWSDDDWHDWNDKNLDLGRSE